MSDARVVHEADVEQVSWSDPIRGYLGFRTLLGDATTKTGFTAGVSSLEPGGWLGHHRHEPSEVYFVLSGTGMLTVDGQDHLVGAGAAVYIPGNSEHAVRNTGSEVLRCFYVFAVDSFEEIEYAFTHAPAPDPQHT